MDTTGLQQKLAAQRHLLPSQHELLNRLLFQLAFNDFQQIGLVGATGSGKSTLALALAELFSEQANVALLTGPVTEQEIEQQLQQHWFGQYQAVPSLAELTAQLADDSQPLLVIVDNFSLLSTAAQQKILQLDCLGFYMLTQASADMALNLSITVLTLQDAGQVLQEQALDPLTVAERFAASGGNMHLLHSAVASAREPRGYPKAFWLIPTVVVLLLLAALVSWYLPISQDTAQPIVIVASEQPADQPVEAGSNPQHTAGSTTAKWVDPVDLAALAEHAKVAEQDDNLARLGSAERADTAELSDSPQLAESLEVANTQSQPQTAEQVEEAEPAVSAELSISANNQVNDDAAASEQTIANSTNGKTASQQANAQVFGYQEQQLLALPPEFRVLQLAVLSSDTALARFKQTYPATAIAIYQRSWQGQLQWVVLIEEGYPDISSARLARASLAEPLRSTGPFIKPVAQVQQEIKALARLRAESQQQD